MPFDDELERMRAAFLAALAAGDASAAAAVYAEDARLLPPGAEPMCGRAAIEAFWRAGFQAGVAGLSLQVSALRGGEELAYEVGSYELRLRPAEASPVAETGNYLYVHARDENGCWRRAVEMFGPGGLATLLQRG
ncbi:MAG TPA: DUF4440 domain-containing protein [Gaiellaceae bacterium]|nr:DUF4440 domain-containing protein [Gaiellaceae bacterium]